MIEFDERMLDAAFPFYLCVDNQFSVVSVGRSLYKCVPDLKVGEPMRSHFDVERPVVESFEDFAVRSSGIFVVRCRVTDVRMRYQAIQSPSRDLLFLVGSPALTSVEDFRRLGLTVSDFAQHDAVPDYVVVVNPKSMLIEEALKLAKDLEVARDAAEAASVAKTQFLATISHEIRTPMNGILGMTELLLRGRLTEKQRGFAEKLHRSGTGLLTLINDLLDFAKMESGKLELERSSFSLEDLVAEVMELFAPRAHSQGLEITYRVEKQLRSRTFLGDSGRLRQALSNLVSNAVKFTERGEISTSVELAEETAGSACVTISVRDTGIGVSSELHGKIFDAFEQADGSMTRKFGGTGLGLSIVKQIAVLMDGDIKVESRVGEGSVFRLSVRLATVADQVTPTDAVSFAGRRVLVVDDCKTTRDLLKTMLEEFQLRVDGTDSVEAATAAFRRSVEDSQLYDLAIVDLEMGSVSESAFVTRIGADSDFASVRTILMTSGVASSLRVKGKNVTGMLLKPIRRSRLLELVERALQASDARPPVSCVPPPQVPAAPIEASGRRGSVLLVEDNEVNREVAVAMLEFLGYDAATAVNGLEAVEMVQVETFDLIFMDCQMPELDGFASTQRIRQLGGKIHQVPIIAMTANVMKGDKERCLNAGMDDYLGKPFSDEQLAEVLEKWLGASAADHAASASEQDGRASRR